MLAALDRLCRLATAVAIVAMVTLITADAIGRSLRVPVPGAVEFTEEYLMVAIVFLALGFTHLERRHIRIEFFARWMPWIESAFVRVGIDLLSLCYFALIAWQGYGHALAAFAIDKRSTAELAYPMGPAYALVVAGAALMCIWLVRDIVSVISGRFAGRGA